MQALKKSIEQGLIGTKQVEENGIEDGYIPIYNSTTGKFEISSITTEAHVDFICKNVKEVDDALAVMNLSGVGGSIALKRGSYDLTLDTRGGTVDIGGGPNGTYQRVANDPFWLNTSNINFFSEGGVIIVPPATNNCFLLGNTSATVRNLRIASLKFSDRSTTKPYIETMLWSDVSRITNIVIEDNVFGAFPYKVVNTTDGVLRLNCQTMRIQNNLFENWGGGVDQAIVMRGSIRDVYLYNNIFDCPYVRVENAYSLLNFVAIYNRYSPFIDSGNGHPAFKLRVNVTANKRIVRIQDNDIYYRGGEGPGTEAAIDLHDGSSNQIDFGIVTRNTLGNQNSTGSYSLIDVTENLPDLVMSPNYNRT